MEKIKHFLVVLLGVLMLIIVPSMQLGPALYWTVAATCVLAWVVKRL